MIRKDGGIKWSQMSVMASGCLTAMILIYFVLIFLGLMKNHLNGAPVVESGVWLGVVGGVIVGVRGAYLYFYAGSVGRAENYFMRH